MDYFPPRPADLADVYALNRALLACLAGSRCGERLRAGLPSAQAGLVRSLNDRQIRRLAAVPFLLVTIREQDAGYWSRLLADDPRQRRLALRHAGHNECCSIVAATIGFVWQLAKRDPYAARVLSGATLDWCEQLAGRPLFEILQCAEDREDLLGLRFADKGLFWGRLLGAGLSRDAAVRNAAHLAALQAMLTDSVNIEYRRLRAAARHTAVPTLKV